MKKRLVGAMTLLVVMAVVTLTFSAYLGARIEERTAIMETRAKLMAEAEKTSALRVETALGKLAKLTYPEELENFAVKDIADLPKTEREAIVPLLRKKLFEANFHRAELYLSRAGDLLRQDNHHPAGKEYLKKAEEILKKMEDLLNQGVEEHAGNSEACARLNYLKGVYFYRQLVFIEDTKKQAAKVEELVGMSAEHFLKVYPCAVKAAKDNDLRWRTDVAIEILQKKAEEMGAGDAGDKTKRQLELLPSTDSQRGPTFAIEGVEEGVD